MWQKNCQTMLIMSKSVQIKHWNGVFIDMSSILNEAKLDYEE